MTPNISSISLIQIGLQIPRWRTKWLPCNGIAVSQAFIFHSSGIAYCISPYASFYAGLSDYNSNKYFDFFPVRDYFRQIFCCAD